MEVTLELIRGGHCCVEQFIQQPRSTWKNAIELRQRQNLLQLATFSRIREHLLLGNCDSNSFEQTRHLHSYPLNRSCSDARDRASPNSIDSSIAVG
jgi:hypothetical protein